MSIQLSKNPNVIPIETFQTERREHFLCTLLNFTVIYESADTWTLTLLTNEPNLFLYFECNIFLRHVITVNKAEEPPFIQHTETDPICYSNGF